MSDIAAFQATYAGLRSLTDGDYRISFDFPGEKFEEVARILSQGGKPSAAKGTWFAIARLNNEGAEPKNPDTHNANSLKTDERQGRSLTQRAAISCTDPQFRLFLEQWAGTKQMIPRGCHVNNENEAAMVVRSFCRVESRSHILPGSAAADRWENLYSQFIVWKNADRYVEAT